MRKLLPFLALLFAIPCWAQTPTLTQNNPTVALGGTISFTCATNCGTGPSWSCANASNGGACFGSIVAGTGVYTAPATLAADQSIGGYPLLSNDHIFNTRIDGLSVNTNSATWIAAISTAPVAFLPSFPLNYANGSTPTDVMSFRYTAGNNGTFQTAQWPTAGIEGGWFDALSPRAFNVDHHMFHIDTTNGNINERYQYYSQAAVPSCAVAANVATCTITPSKTSSGFVAAQQVQFGSFTGADTFFNGKFTLTSATGTTLVFPLTHANASSSTTGQVTANIEAATCSIAGTCNSQSGFKYAYSDYSLPAISTDAAGLEILPLTLHSQEVANACNNSVPINHALRWTLGVGGVALNTFLWPATTGSGAGGGVVPLGARVRLKSAFAIGGFSACAQIILTALKNYGMFLADIGANWQINMDKDNLSLADVQALKDINAAAIPQSNWEFVDESSLMVSASTGATTNGEVITYTASTGSVKTNVNILATAVNIAPGDNQQWVMAGTPQYQLNFFSNGAFTCAESPAVGSVTSDCKYTAPASLTAGTFSTTTVTATSSVTASVKAEILITAMPAANFNLTQGTANFTDSHAVVWLGGYGQGLSSIPSWQGCCQNDASFAAITDKQLWWNTLLSSVALGDYKMDFHVPNGVYLVTYNNGAEQAIGTNVRYFYAQGGLIGTVDPTVAAGGIHLPYTRTDTVSVVNGILSYYNAGIGNETWSTGDVSSISILQTGALAGSTVTPNVVITPGMVIR